MPHLLTEEDRDHLYRIERVINALVTDLPSWRAVPILRELRVILADAIRAHGELVAADPDGE